MNITIKKTTKDTKPSHHKPTIPKQSPKKCPYISFRNNSTKP